MMSQAATWWRARTPREKLLLRICGGLALLVVLPLMAFNAAATYRAQAGAALAAAQADLASVRTLSQAGAPNGGALPAHDGTNRGIAQAAAQAQGLSFERVEAVDGDRLRLVMAPAPAAGVYRWLATLARHGLVASRTVMTRAGEGDLVRASFDIGRIGG